MKFIEKRHFVQMKFRRLRKVLPVCSFHKLLLSIKHPVAESNVSTFLICTSDDFLPTYLRLALKDSRERLTRCESSILKLIDFFANIFCEKFFTKGLIWYLQIFIICSACKKYLQITNLWPYAVKIFTVV